MSSRQRHKIATGIYKDRFGIAIVISVNGKPEEYRKNEHGVPYKLRSRGELIAERKRLQAAAKRTTERAVAKGVSFAADVERFLKTITSPQHLRNLTGIFANYWTPKFGDTPRNDVTELDVQEAYATFKKQPSTLNHIRHALGSFYKAMNGATGYNPARVLRKVREEYHDARALSYDVIAAIFAHMPASPTKARLMVMAYVGLPQALIERIQPQDLKLEARTIYVRPRRKGHGVKGRTLPLSDAGVTALTFFQEMAAFGTFQRSQLQQTFHAAVKRSQVTVPPDVRPYDLRHSFLTEVYRQSGDLRAVAELGMHATLEQTARYATGAVSERATKAVAALPRIPKRGTAPDPSDSVQFAPPRETLGKRRSRGGKPARQAKSRRKTTIRGRSSVG